MEATEREKPGEQKNLLNFQERARLGVGDTRHGRGPKLPVSHDRLGPYPPGRPGLRGRILNHLSLCLEWGQRDSMCGMCSCGLPGWESRADIVTRKIIGGADNTGGCNQTAGQGGKNEDRVEKPSDLLCNRAI